MFQDLTKFQMPAGFRGRGILMVQLWWAIDATLFKCSPQGLYSFRARLLRAFGAKVGRNCIIRPTASITYPWKVDIGDNVWIGDNVVLYSLGDIVIGNNTVISQKSYICAADHDHKCVTFPIRSRPINIGKEVWLGTDVFVGPGCTVGDGSVVGARSSVFKDVPAGVVAIGNPCRVTKRRREQTAEPF